VTPGVRENDNETTQLLRPERQAVGTRHGSRSRCLRRNSPRLPRAYVLATGFVDSSTGIRVCKRFQMFPRGVLSHSVSETTVSELRKVQTQKGYGRLEWSQDGNILAYSRGGIFVAAYDFETEDRIVLGASRSTMTFPESGAGPGDRRASVAAPTSARTSAQGAGMRPR
jgi:hypothetical protein